MGSSTKHRSAPRETARVLSSEMIYQGPIFGVCREEVIEPGEVRATREFVTHPGSVVVLPVLPDGRIVLVRQYRHAIGQFLWELVAGRKEPGESPRRGAARELLEETGYRARRLRVFLDVFPTPGFLTERMYILLAEGLTAGRARPEDDERISTRAFPVAELQQMIHRGNMRDAKSIAGILFYLCYIRRPRTRRER